jgi:4'-phosphopantetheinyl transferase
MTMGSTAIHGITEITCALPAVRLWGIDLDVIHSAHGVNRLVSEEEQARARKFLIIKVAERFLAGRGAVRLILSHHLGVDPGELRFQSNAHGRPSLLGFPQSLDFNFSRSRSRAVLGVVHEGRIGVDLEHDFDDPSFLQAARIILSEEERKEFAVLPDAERHSCLLHTWTTKEAILKALGTGLSVEPSHLNTQGPISAVRILIEAVQVSTMELQYLVPWPGTRMTVALERRPFSPGGR